MPETNTMEDSGVGPMGCRQSRSTAPCRILGIMAVVFIATQPIMAWGATYHLRADGSVTNRSFATGCASPDTAMDISTHNQQTFSPGDTIVLCDEGGVFRAQLRVHSSGLPESPITYDGRGSAVILASTLVDVWTPARGNVYVASLSVQPQQVFINGIFGDRKTSRGALTGNLDWFWEADQLYLFSSTGDPGLAYNNPGVEAGIRSSCVSLRGNHVVITGMTVRHSNRNGIYAWNSGSHVSIKKCLAEWNWGAGIGFEGNSLYENITIEDNESRYNAVGGIGISGPGRNSIIRRNVCHSNGKFQSGEFDYFHQWTFGIKLWEKTALQEGNEIYENVVYDNGRGRPGDRQGRGTGIWIDQVPGKPANPIIIHHNLVYSNKGNGIFIEISSNTVILGNLLHNNAINPDPTGGAAPANIVIDSRLDRQADNNLVYNNTLYGGRYGIKLNTYRQQSGCSISNNIIKNNIVVGASEHSLFCDAGGDNDGVRGTGNVYEYNSFGAESNNFISWDRTEYDTYAAWESAYGGPSHSIEGDPQLAGTSRNDLHLTAGSPCRDAGANLGPAYDDALLESSIWTDSVVTTEQDLHGDGWEVGAYATPTAPRGGGHRLQPSGSPTKAGDI